MPEYLAPGVYVEEIELGSKPIEGVSTSTSGFLGVTRRGPVNKPVFVTNFGEYRSRFGDYLGERQYGDKRWVPYAVDGFFANGGKRTYVTRVAKLDGDNRATVAQTNLPDRHLNARRTLAKPALKGDREVDLSYWTDLAVDGFLRLGDGPQAEYVQIKGFTDQIQLRSKLEQDHDDGATVMQLSPQQATLAESTANSKGARFLSLAATTGLQQQDWVQLQGKTSEKNEVVELETVTEEDTNVQVTSSLRFDHDPGRNVKRVTVSVLTRAVDGTSTPVETIELNSTADLNEGDWVLLQGDTPDSDEVVRLVPTDSPTENQFKIAPRAQKVHPQGNRVIKVTVPTKATTTLKADVVATPETSVTSITLNQTTTVGLIEGNWVLLRGDTSTGDEVVRLGTVTTPETPIDITPSLTSRHSEGKEVILLFPTLTADVDGTSTPVEEISLNSNNGLRKGDWILLQGGTPNLSEIFRLGSIENPSKVPITPHITSSYSNGSRVIPLTMGATPMPTLTAVRNLHIQLSSDFNLKKDDLVFLRDPGQPEFVLIEDIPSSPMSGENFYDVTLASPLRFSHKANREIYRLEPPSSTFQLEGAAKHGAKTINVHERKALSDRVVEILDGAQTEYVQVLEHSETGSGEVMLLNPLRYPHSSGTPIRRLQNTLQILAGPYDPELPNLHPEVGEWGNEIQVEVESVSFARVEITQPPSEDDPALTVSTIQGIEVGSLLRLPGNLYASVIGVERKSKLLFLDGGVTADIADAINGSAYKQAFTCEFTMRFSYGGTLEVFSFLSMDPRHSRYFETVINEKNKSQLVHVKDLRKLDVSTPDSFPVGEEAALGQPLPTSEWYLGGGDDALASIDAQVYRGVDSNDADRRTGLFALLNRTDISIVAVPGQTERDVMDALIAHAERARYRFAVLDSKENDDLDAVRVRRSLYDSKYAALYYPWVQIYDPLEKKPVFAPPSGHICGIYARTDNQIGVFKAPGNATVRQVTGLRWEITKSQQAVLNPRGINAIRASRGRGIRVWGVRTISSDSAWEYINVRRIFIFLEQSIDEATQYAVFEPNDVSTWERLRGSVTTFLTNQWRAGMLQGRIPQEAFFVRIGLGETMIQDDIDNGRMIMRIGVAPVKPAEFVIFRIAQAPGGSAVLE